MNSLLEVEGLTRYFPVRGAGWVNVVSRGRLPMRPGGRPGAAPANVLHAVDDVSFTIATGESVGLVGESGSGKSTVARLVCRLLDPSAGRILFAGRDIGDVPARRFARDPDRPSIQMVFQDATDSLNPRFTAYDAIADPLRRLVSGNDRPRVPQRVPELADLVGLPPELLGRFPHQLSGGQQARAGIARAIALNPKLLVLDEPTSSLDVSMQAVILRLLEDLRWRLRISYLFVSHDLNVVRLLCNRVLVMYLGKIVEAGPIDALFDHPRHPYTRALLSAIPAAFGDSRRRRIHLRGEPRSPIDPSPTVCRFYGRCPDGFGRCATEMPALRHVNTDHAVACHLVEQDAPADHLTGEGRESP